MSLPSREERSPLDGQPQRPSPTGSLLQPAMSGVTVLSCGRLYHTGRDRTGRCPTKTWVHNLRNRNKTLLHFYQHVSKIQNALILSNPISENVFLHLCTGDKSNRRGLPSSCSYGLPSGAAPAHVGLLGEGAQWPAKVWTDCHNPGQAHQKPSQSQRAGQQLSMVSKTDSFTDIIFWWDWGIGQCTH